MLSLAPILVGLGSFPRRRTDPGPLLVVMTGEGLSAESGLHTCGGEDHPDSLVSVSAPAAHPSRLAELQDARRAAAAAARPNAAHVAIARLERDWPGEFLLVTTNVDGLHEAAGSRRVLHLHGRLSEVVCPRCGSVTNDPIRSLVGRRCGACGHEGPHRANVMLPGEGPFGIEVAFAATDRCEVFLAVGCGGAVDPVLQLPRMAARNTTGAAREGRPPCRVVEVTPVPTGDPAFTEVLAGMVAVELPRWVDRFMATAPATA